MASAEPPGRFKLTVLRRGTQTAVVDMRIMQAEGSSLQLAHHVSCTLAAAERRWPYGLRSGYGRLRRFMV